MELLIGIASFLSGSLLSTMSFLLAYSGRFARIETQMKNVCEKVDTLSKQPSYCPLHDSFEKRITKMEKEKS